MLPLIALGALTVGAVGAYIKVGMDGFRLIEKATKESERKRKRRTKQRRYH